LLHFVVPVVILMHVCPVVGAGVVGVAVVVGMPVVAAVVGAGVVGVAVLVGMPVVGGGVGGGVGDGGVGGAACPQTLHDSGQNSFKVMPELMSSVESHAVDCI